MPVEEAWESATSGILVDYRSRFQKFAPSRWVMP